MSVKAISLHQPWASLCVTRQPCETCDGREPWDCTLPSHLNGTPMVKGWETRSWPCPPALIGERIVFHATQRKPTIDDMRVVVDNVTAWNAWFAAGLIGSEGVAGIVLPGPLGAIVGSGRITACYPIYAPPSGVPIDAIYPHVHVYGDGVIGLGSEPDQLCDWSYNDQAPYGDFSPGRYAWQIEDAAPTQERCPWCWDWSYGWRMTHGRCPVCDGAGRCDPVPTKGSQRVWNWSPS